MFVPGIPKVLEYRCPSEQHHPHYLIVFICTIKINWIISNFIYNILY